MREGFTAGGLYYVTEEGAGLPLVALHGGTGLDHTYLRPALDKLPSLRTVYFDLRGHGRSSEPADWSAVDDMSWADDTERLRQELNLGHMILLGHSYGAQIALHYALRHPQHLAGLILVSAAPAIDFTDRMVEVIRSRNMPAAAESLFSNFAGPIPEDSEVFRRMIFDILPLYFAAEVPERAIEIFRRMRLSPRAFNRGFIELRPSFDLRSQLGSIQTPTLVLHGRHDFIPPVDAGGVRLRAGIPTSALVVFENSGHFPHLEEPETFRAAIADWVSTVVAGSSGWTGSSPTR